MSCTYRTYYGFTIQWFGFARCLWIAFQLDIENRSLCIVLFGMLFAFGRKGELVPLKGDEPGVSEFKEYYDKWYKETLNDIKAKHDETYTGAMKYDESLPPQTHPKV